MISVAFSPNGLFALSGGGDPLARLWDLATGKIKNVTQGAEFSARPYPEFMSELIAAGGLIEYTRRRVAARRG